MKNILQKLSSQVKRVNVKLPKINEESPKIQDNNIAINNGVIYEESDSSLRSKTKPRKI
jgi:hypothetical protein